MGIQTREPPRTVGQAIIRAARQWPGAEALVIFGELRLTYEALFRRATGVARALKAAGLVKGDSIGVFLENSIEHTELLLGAMMIGIIPVLFREDVDLGSLADRLPSLNLKAVFVSRARKADYIKAFAVARSPKRKFAMNIWLIDIDDDEPDAANRELQSYALFLDAGKNTPLPDDLEGAVAPSDTMLIDFTAGVTGSPKICRISNEAFMSKVLPFAERIEITEESRLWLPLPMSQGGFLYPFFGGLMKGATGVTQHSFEPDKARRLITQERITHALPYYLTWWLPIVQHVDVWPSDFRQLSHVCLLGPFHALRRAQRYLPHAVLLTTYGATECGGVFCLPSVDDTQEVRLGSVGRPFPGHDVRIVDPASSRTVASGMVGEIQVKSPGMNLLQSDASFDTSFSSDGWLRTGDLGSLDADSVLRYHGRLSEMMTIAGQNISAMEIEALLSGHPAVAVAQVVGVPDDRSGQAAAAFVEVRPGYALDAETLIAFCRRQAGENLVPRYIAFIDTWPVAASKIFKPALEKMMQKPSVFD